MVNDFKLKCANLVVKYREEKRFEEYNDITISFEKNEGSIICRIWLRFSDVEDHKVYLYFTPHNQKEFSIQIEGNITGVSADQDYNNMKIKITEPMIDIKILSADNARVKFIYLFLSSLRSYVWQYNKNPHIPYHRASSNSTTIPDKKEKQPKKLLTTPKK